MTDRHRRGAAWSRFRLAAVVVAAAGIPSPAEAYPIPPVTLWELVEKADTVVLAVVEAEKKHEPRDAHDWSDTVASLSVVERWKGTPGARIDVPYPAGMLCPA